MTEFDVEKYDVEKDRENKLYVAANELEGVIVKAMLAQEVSKPLELVWRENRTDENSRESVRVNVNSSATFPIFNLSYDLILPYLASTTPEAPEDVSLWYAGNGGPSTDYMRTIDNKTDFFCIYQQTTFLKAIDDAVRAYDGDAFKLRLRDQRDKKPPVYENTQLVIDLEVAKGEVSTLELAPGEDDNGRNK
jgi:hypothetical protein